MSSFPRLEYHTYLHHSQTGLQLGNIPVQLEYHTYLHHSQTYAKNTPERLGLSTILIYIILKRLGRQKTLLPAWVPYLFTSFSNIILLWCREEEAWVPYLFTSFSNKSMPQNKGRLCLSTILIYIILKRCCYAVLIASLLEYHTYLHHSQTFEATKEQRNGLSTILIYIILKRDRCRLWFRWKLEYHTYLHHSQTTSWWSQGRTPAWVPYLFTSFSNKGDNGIIWKIAWVPYLFTSFSNLKFKNDRPHQT